MASVMAQINMMIQSLRSEAAKFEDMFAQLQEIQEPARLAFLNCFLDFAGHLEHIGSELVQYKSSKESLHLQNGYSHESEEELSSDLPGSIVDRHQRLLIVLSNIRYCKDELSSELYNKYKCIWLQSREKDEKDSDIQDLVMSFSGLEEKVLEQYTFAQALAQQYSSEFLQAELERTRINSACFVESLPLESAPESAKAAYASFRGSMDSPSRNYRGTQATGSPSFTQRRHR